MNIPRHRLRRLAAFFISATALVALTAQADWLVRSQIERAAQRRVAAGIGATIERESAPQPLRHRARPMIVTSVAAAGPARSVGLEVGDVILAADEQVINSSADLARALQGGEPGRLTVDRQGRQIQMVLRPQDQSALESGGVTVAQAAHR